MAWAQGDRPMNKKRQEVHFHLLELAVVDVVAVVPVAVAVGPVAVVPVEVVVVVASKAGWNSQEEGERSGQAVPEKPSICQNMEVHEGLEEV